MMPELGKYADAVLSSYAVSLVLLVVLVWVSVRRSNRIKTQLQDIEMKAKRNA